MEVDRAVKSLGPQDFWREHSRSGLLVVQSGQAGPPTQQDREFCGLIRQLLESDWYTGYFVGEEDDMMWPTGGKTRKEPQDEAPSPN